MFAEIQKYTVKGHFTFKRGEILSEKSKGVPKLPGVYYIIDSTNVGDELLYAGKSGTIRQNGTCSKQLLRGRINKKQDGIKRQRYFEKKMEENNILEISIYWFVTFYEEHRDLPAFVEGLLVQRYFEENGSLPPWNKKF